jgi:hypothetical protein
VSEEDEYTHQHCHSESCVEDLRDRIALLERTLREALTHLDEHLPLTAAELRSVL